MRKLLLTLAFTIGTMSSASIGSAQSTQLRVDATPLPPLVTVRQRAASGGNNPLLRTLAAVAGSAGGFALAQQTQSDAEPDDIVVPMAAAVAGGAIGTMIFSTFLPAMSSGSGDPLADGQLRVELVAPPGSSLSYTVGKASEVSTIIKALPGVQYTHMNLRAGAGGAFTDGTVVGALLPASERQRSSNDLLALARESLQPVTGVRTTIVPNRTTVRGANPFQVILGSALSALPGAALAMYLVGVTEDEEQDKTLPLIAFSIPHGLLTSAFGQSR